MIGFLARQREATGADLPHRHHLLVEHTRDPDGKGTKGASRSSCTRSGAGRVNRPFGLALSAAWEERYGYRPEMYPDQRCHPPVPAGGALGAQEILSLVDPGSMERLLRRGWRAAGFSARGSGRAQAARSSCPAHPPGGGRRCG